MTQSTRTKKSVGEMGFFLQEIYKDICTKNHGSEGLELQFQIILDWLAKLYDVADFGKKFLPDFQNIINKAKSEIKIFSKNEKSVKSSNELSKIDFDKLGYLACTLAYHQTFKNTMESFNEEPQSIPVDNRNLLKDQIDLIKQTSFHFDVNIISKPEQNIFIKNMNNLTLIYLKNSGYTDSQAKLILSNIERQFKSKLSEIINHKDLQEIFKSFRKSLKVNTQKLSREELLMSHYEYLKKSFYDIPLFEKEPFSLNQVYTPLDCGVFHWMQIKTNNNKIIDQFKEENGGRKDLEYTVLKYLANEKINEPIIIQGNVGSGKSVFTLKLVNSLMEKGIKPIRIKFKDIDFDKSSDMLDILSKSITLMVDKYDQREKLLNEAMLKESIDFYGTPICPYVFIFDGWDEMNIPLSQSHQFKIENVLDAIRAKFIKTKRDYPVRVIVTGQSIEILAERTNLISNFTPILTIRPFDYEGLKNFKKKLLFSLKKSLFITSESSIWQGFLKNKVQKIIQTEVIDKYCQFYNDFSEYENDNPLKKYKILGNPLSAHMIFKIISETESIPENIFNSKIDLYQIFADSVISKQLNRLAINDDKFDRKIYEGSKIHKLIQNVASIISCQGNEKISLLDLTYKLKTLLMYYDEDLLKIVDTEEFMHLLSNYYLKEKPYDSSYEFIHRSFREYFVAESIISVLKEYLKKLKKQHYLYKRTPEEFLREKMFLILSSQWLSKEIREFLFEIIEKEFYKGFNNPYEYKVISPQKWLTIRDAMAESWHWWTEGIHIKPDTMKGVWTIDFKNVVNDNTTEKILPKNINPNRASSILNSFDAYLGDGLFYICVLLHYYPAKEGIEEALETLKRYQIFEKRKYKKLKLFSPSGKKLEKEFSIDYFQNYITRINSIGSYPFGKFLNNAFLCYINFEAVNLRGAHLSKTNMAGANFTDANLWGANLREANLSKAIFWGASFRGANLKDAKLQYSNLWGVNFRGANLSGSNFKQANLRGVDLWGADLTDANFEDVDLTAADLTGCLIENANFRGANITEANLMGSDLRGTNMQDVCIKGTYFADADLAGVKMNLKHKETISKASIKNLHKIIWI